MKKVAGARQLFVWITVSVGRLLPALLMTWFRDCSQPTWCVGWRQKGRSQPRVPAASLVPVQVVNWKTNLGKKRTGGVGQITSLISHHAIAQTPGPAGRRLGRGRGKALGQQLGLGCVALMEDPHPGKKDGHLGFFHPVQVNCVSVACFRVEVVLQRCSALWRPAQLWLDVGQQGARSCSQRISPALASRNAGFLNYFLLCVIQHTPKPLMEHNHSFQFNNVSRRVINIQLHMLSPVLCKQ